MTRESELSPPLFFLTGIMAAGKSSVAQALAGRFPQSVHLRGDIFRRMIVCGQTELSSVALSLRGDRAAHAPL